MSVVEYPLNGKDYFIGTVGMVGADWIWNYGMKVGDWWSQIWDSRCPTYGYWAGPGYAGGARQRTNAAINWYQPPCWNKSIEITGANPGQCLSLLDAITKTHDFRYTLAEELAAAGGRVTA